MKKSELRKLIKEELLKEESPSRPYAGSMMGKYIETKHPEGYDMVMSFHPPNEEELGLDYGTLEEILEVKDINGVKVYCVYI